MPALGAAQPRFETPEDAKDKVILVIATVVMSETSSMCLSTIPTCMFYRKERERSE